MITDLRELWIVLATLVASTLTLLTGFGLATILTPVFAVFYDIKLAVFLVAIVHFLNNVLKVWLFRKSVDRSIIKRFGAVSIAGALLGAFVQIYLFMGVLKQILGFVLLFIGGTEFFPSVTRVKLPRKIDPIGGFLSGFIGGLVGNQGAIRSAYLLNYGLPKEVFIGTAAVIALIIDATRIPVYMLSFGEWTKGVAYDLLIPVLIAFIGTFIGTKILHAVRPGLFRHLVAGSVVLMGILFLLGIL